MSPFHFGILAVIDGFDSWRITDQDCLVTIQSAVNQTRPPATSRISQRSFSDQSFGQFRGGSNAAHTDPVAVDAEKTFSKGQLREVRRGTAGILLKRELARTIDPSSDRTSRLLKASDKPAPLEDWPAEMDFEVTPLTTAFKFQQSQWSGETIRDSSHEPNFHRAAERTRSGPTRPSSNFFDEKSSPGLFVSGLFSLRLYHLANPQHIHSLNSA
jgi:hypothetical protein